MMVTFHFGDEISQGFLDEPVPLESGATHRTECRLDRGKLEDFLALADLDRTVGL